MLKASRRKKLGGRNGGGRPPENGIMGHVEEQPKVVGQEWQRR